MQNGEIESRRLFLWGLALLLATYACLVTIRLATPDDLGMRDQWRVGSYIIDVVQNGNWLCPRDANGAITSKPPMHPWIAAIASHALGGTRAHQRGAARRRARSRPPPRGAGPGR